MEHTIEKVIPEIVLEGSPYEIGYGHGKQLGNSIRAFIGDDFAQMNKLRSKPLTEMKLNETTSQYARCIEKYLPELTEELKGLSDGAGITMNEAVMLQIRREILGTSGFTLMGDCTSIACRSQQGIITAQTIDLNGDMTELGNVFRIKARGSSPEILMYAFGGLLGYMGMNSYGLSVTINLVISGAWTVGIPPYLLVRQFLGCKNIEECIKEIKKIPLASSRSFTISDANRQVIIELTPSDHRIIENDLLLHTNHYIHPDFKTEDRMNVFSKNSSVKRLELIQRKINENGCTAATIQSIFADHSLYPTGVCAHNESNMKINETVAAIIMHPMRGEFLALKGKPCQREYATHTLNNQIHAN
jgi:isopenicillin-N N-acyltransferase like protein